MGSRAKAAARTAHGGPPLGFLRWPPTLMILRTRSERISSRCASVSACHRNLIKSSRICGGGGGGGSGRAVKSAAGPGARHTPPSRTHLQRNVARLLLGRRRENGVDLRPRALAAAERDEHGVRRAALRVARVGKDGDHVVQQRDVHRPRRQQRLHRATVAAPRAAALRGAIIKSAPRKKRERGPVQPRKQEQSKAL